MNLHPKIWRKKNPIFFKLKIENICVLGCLCVCSSLSKSLSKLFSCIPGVIFRNISCLLCLTAVLCGVHLRSAFDPIVGELPEQIFSIDFCAWMPNFPCHTFAYSQPRGKKMETRDWRLNCCVWRNMKLTGSLLVSLSENRHVLFPPFLALSPEFSLHFTFYPLFHSLPDNRH